MALTNRNVVRSVCLSRKNCCARRTKVPMSYDACNHKAVEQMGSWEQLKTYSGQYVKVNGFLGAAELMGSGEQLS